MLSFDIAALGLLPLQHDVVITNGTHLFLGSYTTGMKRSICTVSYLDFVSSSTVIGFPVPYENRKLDVVTAMCVL